MFKSGFRRWRVLLAAVVLLSTLVIATAAASPDHWHSSAASDTCAVCHAGHLPFLEVPGVLEVFPPETLAATLRFDDPAYTLHSVYLERQSRAPPIA
ncbi:MAG: hypothetical protein ACRD7E_00105 [Bryobacteraceae bacterium]